MWAATTFLNHQKILRKFIYVSAQYAVRFHVQVEEWKDGDETRPRDKYLRQIVQTKREGNKHK